jgi:hypothetical protein
MPHKDKAEHNEYMRNYRKTHRKLPPLPEGWEVTGPKGFVSYKYKGEIKVQHPIDSYSIRKYVIWYDSVMAEKHQLGEVKTE